MSKVNHILGKEQQNQYGSTSKTINHEVCSKSFCCRCWNDKGKTDFKFTQYPIIRNGDQRRALEFLKNYQFPDADRFLILQG